MRKTVVMCVCHRRTFSEILEIAEKQGWNTLEELRENDICSNGCKMCEPYVEKTLRTGETAFIPGDVY